MKPAEKDPQLLPCAGNQALDPGSQRGPRAVEMGVMGWNIQRTTAKRKETWPAGLLAGGFLVGISLAGIGLAGSAAPVAGTGLDIHLYGKTFTLDAGQLKDGELRRFDNAGHRLELKRSGESLQVSLDGKAVPAQSPESALKVNQPLLRCQLLAPADTVPAGASPSAPAVGRLASDLSLSATPVKAGGKSPVNASKSPEPLLKVPAKDAAGGCEDVPATDDECGSGASDSLVQPPTSQNGVGPGASIDPRVRITCVRRDGPAL